MCGIAGVIDLTGTRSVAPGAVEAMQEAMFHRGPDEGGLFVRPGLAFASRRLSIVGLADGQQPVANEDRSVHVVYNGELFDYPERRIELEGKGHRFRTHCDTELLPHLWEDHQEGMFPFLKGQFAFALWDERRRQAVLGRDRFGICPLFWSRQGDWLLFASEIKALLASGMVDAKADPRGLNHLFTFFGIPGPVTCFAGVNILLPGRYLTVTPGRSGGPDQAFRQQIYWQVDFPDAGEEMRVTDPSKLVDGFEDVLLKATEKRLRADVPVVSYLSGGVDSSTVVALAKKARGTPIPTYTIRIKAEGMDETVPARQVAQHVGSSMREVDFDDDDAIRTFPMLIEAAESPVVDTSCAALLMLARQVRADGFKVSLTGEGSDEWLTGYMWYKVHRALGFFDLIPGIRLSTLIRRTFLTLAKIPKFPRDMERRTEQAVGGPNAWLYVYGVMGLSKLRFFSPEMREVMTANSPYEDLELNLERAKRWSPLNRSLYVGSRVHLPGLLLNAKGDRVAMHNSVETRYPFLDEDVFDYLSRVPPEYKMKGFKDKYLLRLLAERWLPKEIAWRPKGMFRAPLDSFHLDAAPAYVDELLSEESLKRTGYFDIASVRHWRKAHRDLRPGSTARNSIEMGLSGVVSTQLWHHTYIDGSLAALPSRAGTFTAIDHSKSQRPVVAPLVGS